MVVWEEEVYEDDDDENEEGNWRNEYPEEGDSDVGSDAEERFGGTSPFLSNRSQHKAIIGNTSLCQVAKKCSFLCTVISQLLTAVYTLIL